MSSSGRRQARLGEIRGGFFVAVMMRQVYDFIVGAETPIRTLNPEAITSERQQIEN